MLGDIELAGIDLLVDLLTFLHERPGTHTGTILEHWRDHEYGRHLAKLSQTSIDLEQHRLEAEFVDTLAKLEKYRRSSPEQILAKISRGELPTDEEKLILQQKAQSTQNKSENP